MSEHNACYGQNAYNTSREHYALSQDHADIRRESAVYRGDIVHAVSKEACDINGNVKEAGWNVSDRVGTEADRITAQGTAYYIASQNDAHTLSRDVAAMKAATDMSFQRLQFDIAAGIDRAAAATALESSKVAAAVALGQALLSKEIYQDGTETRKLINELKMTDLNRELIERQNVIVEERCNARGWRGNYEQSQYAAVNQQLQAFGSQLQETRQGMVNFGTMAGVGQTSSSNNV